MDIVNFGLTAGAAFALLYLNGKRLHRKRQRFIDRFSLPKSIDQKILQRYPHLNPAALAKVHLGLRNYFHLCNDAGRRTVSMPSQVVDVAWHELILFTRQYQQFCRSAFGRFLHHTPAEAMKSPTLAHDGIKRAWRLACAREQLPARNPVRLPLLFGLDAELDIADGFRYSLDCMKAGGSDYCASHIGCSSGCAGSSGSCSSDGDSSGCSSGCGGD